MLTPQDIQSKEFAKAVFGGYDMVAVDDFLEELTENYTSLYKENAILKGKIKVLVEKVEEYRSTEDAMRMALLTAQKMSDDMVSETKKKCDDMLAAATQESDNTKQSMAKVFAEEEQKLNAAKAKTAAFVQASRQIIEQYSDFLEKLDGVTNEYGGVDASASASAGEHEAEPKYSPEPEPASKAAPAATTGEVELDGTIKEIDSFVAGVMDGGETSADEDMSAETRRIDTTSVRDKDVDDSPTRRIEWDEEDELTTPRPKFDFSDLKFGSNYSGDEK